MPIIDFHNHYYPPAYLEALKSGASNVRVTTDEQGNPWLHYPGDYNIAVRGHRDIDYREQVLAEHGVDMQVLTLTTPGTHVESPGTAARLASLVNDAFAEVAHSKGSRFTALATLPLNDPKASARELERASLELGLRGAMLFSNVNGVALNDPRFWPLYEAANDLEAVLYIHPTNPAGVEAMMEYWLMPLVGFLFDTTTPSISTRARSNWLSPSPAPITSWPAATTRTKSGAWPRCSRASGRCPFPARIRTRSSGPMPRAC